MGRSKNRATSRSSERASKHRYEPSQTKWRMKLRSGANPDFLASAGPIAELGFTDLPPRAYCGGGVEETQGYAARSVRLAELHQGFPLLASGQPHVHRRERYWVASHP